MVKRYEGKPKPKGFYNLNHRSNLDSILKYGLCCKNFIISSEIDHISLANTDIQTRRQQRKIFEDKTVHDFVPLFMGTKTPMISEVIHRWSRNDNNIEDIIILRIDPIILNDSKLQLYYSDGNLGANHDKTNVYGIEKWDEGIDWDAVNSTIFIDWHIDIENKRKKSAELLVYDKVPKEYITTMFINYKPKNYDPRKKFHIPGHPNIKVLYNRPMFFLSEED